MYRRGGKRVFDVVVALMILVPALLIMGVVAILVRINLGSPVLFRQPRPGRNGEVFVLTKFRTMTSETDKHGSLLPDEQRLSRFGAFLRSTSLDELPELRHVLTGHMSLVGPRPLRVRYLDRYTSEQARRHEVRPGITGWAQVHGRNNSPWPERLAMDVWYVDHYSLGLDLRVLGRTMLALLKRSDTSQEGHVTATEFTGIEQTS